MISRADADDLLDALLTYLRDRGLITPWLKSRIKLVRSQRATEQNQASPRQFCFVVIGQHDIHFAAALLKLPTPFIVGIQLHEIAHMVIEEKGDPELGVDEWVIEQVPEAGYHYRNVSYGKRRARSLECVSGEFCDLILATAEF